MADNVTSPIPATTKFKSKDTGTNGHLMGHTLYDEAEAEVLGKVTANPTANTVLGRLKDLLTGIVLSAGSAVIGAVTQSGTWTVQPGNTANTTAWKVDGSAVTQPVSGTVSITDISSAEYETVAASQTAQVLGATGGTGDYISHITVIPTSVSPGVVTLLDNATSIPVFAGGTDSLSNLAPFTIVLGAKSTSGAWKLTTGAGLSCIAFGNFTA
ncbi:hypothetical protein [Bradyrhizobium sp. URHD0069]|uniref:hypothetical protein n=1 Tax=Bradyrhizobium sp. URHD0069 TaxID=1380355 RepID=UPI0004963C79|nr:hypothetical protein [Bradyrhizobium sp. URHD0069]